MSNSIYFSVGNTYREIRALNAKLDRSRRYRKIHDWELYVLILSDNVDLIDHVIFDMQHPTFDPQEFKNYSPTKFFCNDGSLRWRFATRQQTYGTITCKVTLVGRGGSRMSVNYYIRTQDFAEPHPRCFVEERPQKALGPTPMPPVKFGIELELTSSRAYEPNQVAHIISRHSGHTVAVMTDQYALASRTYGIWKLMGDSSIECHIHRPDCNTFELVSPILCGAQGLQECHDVLNALKIVPSIKVNKSMGFHVHVNVKNIGHTDLIKVCQNFIKYEDAIDSMMPPSRRNNSYCKSNKAAVLGSTNLQRHKVLERCTSLQQLGEAINPSPGERYYKLNFQNLTTGRQPTLEFRQHSATLSSEKILNWVRFCVSFVTNSIRLRAPACLKSSHTVDEQVDMLFQYVIKDRYLAKFYDDRRNHLQSDEMESGECCCHGCASGGSCSVSA